MMTTTLDGFIAREPNDGATWAEAYDKLFFDSAARAIGTVIMGANTFALLPGPLEGCLNIVMKTSPNDEGAIPGQLEFFSGEPSRLLEELEKRDIHEVALIGGSQVNASFLLEGLVDDIFITVAPILFGQGLSLSTGYDLDVQLRLLEERALENDALLLHYEVVT